MREPLVKPAYVTTACLALLFGGLLLDLTTQQELVVAITYNIPIALSGLALSRQLTIWTLVLALAANLAAGYENALIMEGYDTLTLLNRVLSALSFLLVGVMTLALNSASDQVTALAEKEAEADRERRLRSLVKDLGHTHRPEALLHQAAAELRELLSAESVVITHLQGERFALPRYSDPEDANLAKPGTLSSWALDAIPLTDTPVITVRSERGVTTVGRWRGEDELVVVAARPQVQEASALLGEALKSLEPLLARAKLIEQLQANGKELENLKIRKLEN